MKHVVSPASHEFLGAYRRPGSDSVNQNELIGKVSRLWVLKPSLDNFFEIFFFDNLISGLFEQKQV
jgi:hypothetical protein